MKARVMVALLAAGISACGASAVPEPTAADAQRGSSHFPDLTLSELSHGRALYVSRCGSCHALKRPSELRPERWQAEVDDMRANNGVKLSDADARAIVRYLTVASNPG